MVARIKWSMYYLLYYLLYYQNIQHDENLSDMLLDLTIHYPVASTDKQLWSTDMYNHLLNICGDGKRLNPTKIKLLYQNLTYDNEAEVRQLRFIYHYLQLSFVDDLVNELELFV